MVNPTFKRNLKRAWGLWQCACCVIFLAAGAQYPAGSPLLDGIVAANLGGAGSRAIPPRDSAPSRLPAGPDQVAVQPSPTPNPAPGLPRIVPVIRLLLESAEADHPQPTPTPTSIQGPTATATHTSVPTPTATPVPIPSDMILIPRGTFLMGNSVDVSCGYPVCDDAPVHQVTLDPFLLGKSEVTKAQWDEVYTWATNHGYRFSTKYAAGKAPNHPEYGMNRQDALIWCNARSEKEGRTPCYSTAYCSVYRDGWNCLAYLSDVLCNWSANGYRLPTEAEWEYAARGGLACKRFPWGDRIDHGKANYCSATNMYSYDDGPVSGYHPAYENGNPPYTAPVGSFLPNGLGVCDMAGNLAEMCWDGYDPEYYYSSPKENPRGPIMTGVLHDYEFVVRGGCWGCAVVWDSCALDGVARECSVFHREGGSSIGSSQTGFRLAMSSPAKAIRIEMITPSGDPVNAPVDGGDGQNEFTFSTNSSGGLELNLKAEVTPEGMASQIASRCRFSVDAIGNSTLRWDVANSNGTPTASNDFLLARVTFNGLPTSNAAFGSKQAILYFDGAKMDEQPYEVFYAKWAQNHGGGSTADPNWFYFWKDGGACGIDTNCLYDGTRRNAWGYCRPGSDMLIRLCALAPELNSGPESYYSHRANDGYGTAPDGQIVVTGQGAGIQCVAETIQHEREHLNIYSLFHGQTDNDSDGIPNAAETTPNATSYGGIASDLNASDTYNMGGAYAAYGDNEIRCRKTELSHTIAIHPDRDWANPGCQSKNKCGP